MDNVVVNDKSDANDDGTDRSADIEPLSSGQRRLWWLQQRDPDSPAYNSAVAIRFPGALEATALRRALALLTQRHEMLRTRYVSGEDGGPGQVIDDAFTVPVTWLPRTHPSHEEAVTRAAAEPFDLAAAPPVRATVVPLEDGSTVLVLVIHHIATDGRSFAVLVRDLSTAYSALSGGADPVLTEPKSRYTDHVAWQHGPEGLQRAAAAVQYWRTELDGFEQLSVTTDFPRPRTADAAGATVGFALPAGTTRALRAFALRQRSALSSAVAAAFEAVLARWTGRRDITIGTVLSGRGRPEFDDVVGFFVNTVVLRVDVPSSTTYRDLVRATQAKMTAAYEHQDAPFDEVVAAVAPVRQPGHTPLFDVMYVHDGDLEQPASGQDIGRVPIEEASSRFDLELKTCLLDGCLTGELTYRTDLFERDTVEAITACLVRLIRWVLDAPDRPVFAFPLLDEEEERHVLALGEGARHDVPEATLPGLFAAQAERTPLATAVVAPERTLTYAELDHDVARLAAALVTRGVRAGSVVAVRIPRSAELIVALHAVHRVGAAYLPVDPEHPTERVAYLLQDAQPQLTLEQDDVRALLAEATQPYTPVPCSATADGIAYVIYTSGSTGRPKGVAVTHRAIANRLAWMQGEFPIGPDDRVLQKTPVGFDVSVWELFWPTAVGATLVLATPGGHRDPAYLIRLIREQRITDAHFVPSMLRVFLAEPGVKDCTGLRRVFASGEALSGDLREAFFEVLDAELTNLYGPTEAAVEVSLWRCSRTDPPGPVPIGRAVWNTQLRVLDADLRPVPPGVTGELYIAGVQLAVGYVGRPELTAERFVDHPYGPPGSRMYRTGDLARLRRDGAIDYLGRIDDQVKVNGVRIEPGEIEAVLKSHEAVADAVVVARNDGTGLRLVAYVVPAGAAGRPPTSEADLDAFVADVRRHAVRRLPGQMVPASVMVLDRLPVSVNGKLARAELPAPRFAPTSVGAGPRTPVEEVLSGLFAEVLDIEEAGVDTDFFLTGGHSLLGLQLIGRIRTVLGLEVGIATLFEAPTVAGLAQRLASGDDADAFAPLLPLRGSGEGLPLFCIHPAAGLSWVYSPLLRHLTPDTPVYGLQSPGLAHGPSPATVQELADMYLTEIRAVQPQGPYRLLGWSFGGLVAHAVATRLQAEGEQVDLLALLDAYPLHTRASRVPDQEDTSSLLRLLLESLGHRAPAAPSGSFGSEQFTEVLRSARSALGGLDDAQVRRMADVFGGNMRMAHAFEPGVFDGDLVLFRAEADASVYGPAPRDWAPYLTGRLDVRPIATTHGEMTQTGPMSEIGPVVAERLSHRDPDNR